MNELIAKYLDYIVEHQMRNDAGIRAVRDKLQGNPGIWAVAVMRYAQTMKAGDASYLAFRNKWAWDNEKVDKVLASDEGKLMKSRIAEVADFFKGLDRQIKLATDNNVDLKIVLALGLIGFTVIEVGATAATPVWVTLSLFVVNHFIELHTHHHPQAATAPVLVRG